MLTKGYCRPFKAQSLYVIGRRHDSVDTTGRSQWVETNLQKKYFSSNCKSYYFLWF